jgi:hypothetical protein
MPTEFKTVLATALNGAHFFEVTEALPLAEEVADAAIKAKDSFAPCTFLPAPNTWLEWREINGTRYAVSFREDSGKAVAQLFRDVNEEYVTAGLGVLNLQIGHLESVTTDTNDDLPDKEARRALCAAYFCLAIINSPRIVGRRVHLPHKGLARELAKASGVNIGPLHDWHEIKLEIHKPESIDDGEPHEATLTGRRALHFCRKHVRIRLGKLEYVRAHWRGDPAIGIRRARYVVTA